MKELTSNQRRIKNVYNVCTVTGIAFAILVSVLAYKSGALGSAEAMEATLRTLGIWAPIVFTLFQVIQVVVPVIPGGIACIAGIAMFGPIYGFLYNYLGICLGSVINFLLAKRYGDTLIRAIVSEKLYDKYSAWLDKSEKSFNKLFAIAIFLPVAPDDFLCLLAGMSKMSLKTFSAILLLGKPASLALYSMGLYSVFKFLT